MKRINKIFIIVVSIGFLNSCTKKMESPNFDVTSTVTKISVPNAAGTALVDAYEVKFLFRIRRLGRCDFSLVIQSNRFILNHPTNKQIKDSLHIIPSIESKMIFI